MRSENAFNAFELKSIPRDTPSILSFIFSDTLSPLRPGVNSHEELPHLPRNVSREGRLLSARWDGTRGSAEVVRRGGGPSAARSFRYAD